MRPLDHFAGILAGQDIILYGLGPTAQEAEPLPNRWAIGVNNIQAYHDVDFLVLVDSHPSIERQRDRWPHVRDSRARVIFTNERAPWSLKHPVMVPFPVVASEIDPAAGWPEAIPAHRTSTHCALALAAHLGASRVITLGVDLTDPKHLTGPHRGEIVRMFVGLAKAIYSTHGTKTFVGNRKSALHPHLPYLSPLRANKKRPLRHLS